MRAMQALFRPLHEDLALRSARSQNWVLVKEGILRYHNKETILFTIDPHYGNLN